MSSIKARALVTGASSGIGEATARKLASEGFEVALLARNREALERIEGSLPGDGHRVVPCDLCDVQQVETAFAQLSEAWDHLDLVVNNAGLGYRARVAELDDALLERLFRTNVLGLLHCSRLSLPLLRRGTLPVLVNVSSVVGRRGIPGQVAYSASKAAVCSIGEGLRIEWAKEGIAVCTLNPALTATGFFEAQANPSDLPHPDMARASGPDRVAEEIFRLARHPQPERNLRWKWRLLSAVSVFAPRFSDRLLVKNLGDGWRAPRR